MTQCCSLRIVANIEVIMSRHKQYLTGTKALRVMIECGEKERREYIGILMYILCSGWVDINSIIS